MAGGDHCQAAAQLGQALFGPQDHIVRRDWFSVPPGMAHQCHAPSVARVLQLLSDVLQAARQRDHKNIVCIDAMRLKAVWSATSMTDRLAKVSALRHRLLPLVGSAGAHAPRIARLTALTGRGGQRGAWRCGGVKDPDLTRLQQSSRQ